MVKLDSSRQVPQSFVVISAFLLLLFCYHLIFGYFFPNFQGTLGNDYALLLPALLNGYFWFKSNPLWEVPWFSPAFCGGQPFFADVQSNYYSLAQLLTVFFDPLTSAYLSIIFFAGVGFWSMYALMRYRFSVTVESSFLAASLFMFNGFYAHRMILGHFGYQGVMLIPLVALFILPAADAQVIVSKRKFFLSSTLVALLLAYWLQSGLASLIVPIALAVLAIVCLAIKPQHWKVFAWQAIVAASIALALSAAKLVAGLSFMRHFQRSHYQLPGIEGVLNELKVLFIALFFAPANIAERAVEHIKQMQWLLERHEWEFGVSIIPLGVMLAAWSVTGWKKWRGTAKPAEKLFKSRVGLWILVVILIIPFVINLYSPWWNGLLKQTPLLKSSSALFRWWLIYIPVVIIYAVLLLERLALAQKLRAYVVSACVVILLLINLGADRMFYHIQSYSPMAITQAYQEVAAGKPVPAITEVNAFHNEKYAIQMPLNRNDLLINGQSQLACYNPSFGYRLENLPFKDLHIGSIWDQTNGYFNLKNPACYVFPDENQCQPGAHFHRTQKVQLEAFAHYQPFAFKVSLAQKIASFISELALVGIVFFLGFMVLKGVSNRARFKI